MRKLTLFGSLMLIASTSYGQQFQRCLSHEAVKHEINLNPSYKDRYESIFTEAKKNSTNQFNAKSDIEYTIPVVVHVVYNTPEQNLPDSVIYNQIQVLNQDFGRLNADTANMRSDFSSIAGNPKIRFMLATIDPEGNPTTGITRTQTNLTTFGSLASMMGSMGDIEKIKSTADGGIDPWNQTRYLNIWVGNMGVNLLGTEMVALLGYATPPANLPNWPAGGVGNLKDGVVVQFQVFGSNNPNPIPGMDDYVAKGRTATHEVGHYLGLRHIWGDDADCLIDDGLEDTPGATAQSESDCNTSKNSCVDNIGSLGDLPDMVENFMDYSAETCQNSFTKGQVGIMRGVLEGPRYDLVNNNVASTTTVTNILTSIYPNPTNSNIQLTFSQAPESIQLIDAQGRIVLTQNNIDNLSLTLDLSALNSGIYLLQVGNSLTKERIAKF